MIEQIDAEDVLRGLAAVMGEAVRSGPPQRMEDQILGVLDRLSPVEAESFASALGSVGKFLKSDQIRDIAATAAPIVGGTVGTVFGGPAGTAIGGSVGGMVGQAIAGKPSSNQAAHATQAAAGAVPSPVPAAAAPSVASAPATQAASAKPVLTPPSAQSPVGSTAAAQLLSVVQDPALLASLLALILGDNGRSTVAVGTSGTEVPVGAMVTLLGVLANRAADDAESILAARQDALPAYLIDSEGCLTCDPAVPSERADALLRLMQSRPPAPIESAHCECAECAGSAAEWTASTW